MMCRDFALTRGVLVDAVLVDAVLLDFPKKETPFPWARNLRARRPAESFSCERPAIEARNCKSAGAFGQNAEKQEEIIFV
jgi:hypothetical protein